MAKKIELSNMSTNSGNGTELMRGHSMALVGYHPKTESILFKNSCTNTEGMYGHTWVTRNFLKYVVDFYFLQKFTDSED